VSVPLRHLGAQGANVGALLRVGWSLVAPARKALDAYPGPELTAMLTPRNEGLIDDFVAWAGGERSAWDGVPPHFFPQWALPLLARTLDDQPHPIARVLNQGCRLTFGALPAGEPLEVSAQLLAVEDGERKVRLTQKLVTGTASAPAAMSAEVYAVVPKGSGGGGGGERPVVDAEWPRLCTRDLPSSAGWQFALLTGDFNPIHWLHPYARIAGFKACILHGFGMLALVVEALAAEHGAAALKTVDVRFLKPLVLPASVEIAAADGHVGLGVPGKPAAMLGTYELHSDPDSAP
jgi:hypothetical protein